MYTKKSKIMILVMCAMISMVMFPNIILAAIPSVPTNLTATATSSSEIELTWDAVTDATGYYVYMAASSSGTYSKKATVTTTTFTNTETLAPSTTYYFKIKAYNASGTSAYSTVKYAKTLAPTAVPDVPANLQAESTSSSTIYLTWDIAKDATSYYIYRATSSTGTYTKVGTSTKNYYTNSSLTSNKTYYYKIKSYNSFGTSDFSNPDHATTDSAINDIPDAPSGLTATVESSSEIYLSWDEVDNATSYYVYRANSSSGSYSKIDTVTSEYYTDSGLTANKTYYYIICSHNSYGTSGDSEEVYATTDSADGLTGSTSRLYGQNRYETAAEIAESGWTSSYYAIIASGEDYPDALCSAPLAKKYNAPILLTTQYALDDYTKQQLSNLNVQKVFIIGGTGVVASNVELAIKSMGIDVERLYGNDRYETSVMVAKAIDDSDTAVIATGNSFADALSISVIAAIKGYPILLTASDSLPAGVKNYLDTYIENTFVIGGTGAVSSNIFSQLPSPERVSGADRYDTNYNVLNKFESDLNFDISYVATGANYPDALAGSALAAKNIAPIILTNNVLSQSMKDLLNEQDIENIVAFGGTSVISESFINSITGSGGSTTANAPGAPDNLTATALSSSQIYLDWDSVSNATSYYVYRATSSTGTYSKIATVTATYYTNTGLNDNTTYYYKIQAHNSYGTSAYSAKDYATTEYTVSLDAPDNLDATALSDDQIYLTWDEVSEATSYYIYRATSYSGTYTKIATVTADSDNVTAEYTNSGLSSGKTYYYKVKTYSSGELSSYSSVASATTE